MKNYIIVLSVYKSNDFIPTGTKNITDSQALTSVQREAKDMQGGGVVGIWAYLGHQELQMLQTRLLFLNLLRSCVNYIIHLI